MSEENKKEICLSCADCAAKACRYKEDTKYPAFCLTKNIDQDLLNETTELYKHDAVDKKLARTAAYIEGNYYGKYPRVKEIIEFIKKYGAKKVGIATCVGLLSEAKIFAELLRKHDIEFYSVCCKVGAVEKNEIGIPKKDHVAKGTCYESMCNPIMQAKILNEQGTDLNIMIGLCVGHDALFTKYSDAPVTVLAVKDRVTHHNPLASLYLYKAGYTEF